MRWAARVEGAVLPQVEVKVFTPADREEALAWASQPLPAPEAEAAPAEPSVRLIETTSPNVIAFEVDGRIRAEDMRRLIATSEEAMKAHEHVNVLVRVSRFDGVGLDAPREEGLASMKMKGWKQVDRYALVGGPAWMATVTGWFTPLVRTQTRHFDLDQEDEAWRWIGAERAPETP
jgi:hypothetical protein